MAVGGQVALFEAEPQNGAGGAIGTDEGLDARRTAALAGLAAATAPTPSQGCTPL
ncbi:hypothetical protein ACI2L4_10240 [Streptomyces sparsogenes]|uniref:hypothetical protein n=1 Tax=Streptomyces sparsogenes TaxID=67365 RepID=UPI00384F6224